MFGINCFMTIILVYQNIERKNKEKSDSKRPFFLNL